jgi:hypothetical protein
MSSQERLIFFYTIGYKFTININQTHTEIINELKSKLKYNINCLEFYDKGEKININKVDFTQINNDIFYKFIPIII